jgi:hypothetical protein
VYRSLFAFILISLFTVNNSAAGQSGAASTGETRTERIRSGTIGTGNTSVGGVSTGSTSVRDTGTGQIRIVDRPVSFSERREAGMLRYIEEHYGLKQSNLEFTPRMIVLHWTEIETFEGTFQTFNQETTSRTDISGAGDVNVSIQFVVDRDGTIYRLQPENWMARHVIGLNHVSIGIENVGTGTRSSDTLTDAQIEANVLLIRDLITRYPTIEYVIGHHEYQRFENDPLWGELDQGYRTIKIDPGDRFMAAVRAQIRDLEMKGPPK